MNFLDLDYDEIVSIESVGVEETVNITVEDTHMFFANDIYTHNSSISAEVVTSDQMGGNIKKAQIAHVILSIAKTLEQKESKTATLSLLKSRIGDDGVIFPNCKFDNKYLEIDTETQTTLLGIKMDKEDDARRRAKEAYERVNRKRQE